MSQYLVNTPHAVSFMELALTDTGTKAFIADETKFDSSVGPLIASTRIALRQGAEKCAALAGDPTRTEVAKHHAAQQVGQAVCATLEKAAETVARRADELIRVGTEEANRGFAIDASRAALDAEIRAYVKDQLKRPDGLGIVKVRELLQSNFNVANAIYNAESFLLGLEPTLHTDWRVKAIESHFPAAYEKVNSGADLQTLPPKFNKAIGSVRSTFFNAALAAQASRRVQV